MEPSDPRPGADLSATRLDRLRSARVTPPAARPRAVLPWLLTAVLLAFALGLIANPWFERSVRSRLPGFAPTVTPTMADVATLETRIAALEARPAVRATGGTAAPDTGGGERLGRVEGTVATLGATVPAMTARTDRIATDLAALTARIDASAGGTAAALASATASADRAQAMLVAGAVRRQLAAGVRLGPLEPAFRRSFAARAGPQVEAVVALSTAPVTAATLRAALAALRPVLTGTTAAVPGAARDWWSGLRDSLAGIVRPASGAATATDPTARLDRADRALADGNVAAAAVEIAALPATVRMRARAWSSDADRYLAGWRAMAALEAMLLDPLPAAPVPPGA